MTLFCFGNLQHEDIRSTCAHRISVAGQSEAAVRHFNQRAGPLIGLTTIGTFPEHSAIVRVMNEQIVTLLKSEGDANPNELREEIGKIRQRAEEEVEKAIALNPESRRQPALVPVREE